MSKEEIDGQVVEDFIVHLWIFQEQIQKCFSEAETGLE
jgi:hypothetical protein